MSRELELIETAILPITGGVDSYPQDKIDLATTYTLWSWYDVMIAFREIGYQPTEVEEQRIKRALFTKKIKHLLKER